MNQLYSAVDPLASLSTKVATGGRLNLGRALDRSVADQPGSGVDLKMLSVIVNGATGLQVRYEVIGANFAEFELGMRSRELITLPGAICLCLARLVTTTSPSRHP